MSALASHSTPRSFLASRSPQHHTQRQSASWALLVVLASLAVPLCSGCATLEALRRVEAQLAEALAQLEETKREAAMAIANASCGKEVSDLVKDVSALCVKGRWCEDSEIISAISDADPQGRFLLLMKTQRSAAFYFPNTWENPVHMHRLEKIISKRMLPRTKVLVVANTTARKPQKGGGSDDTAILAARDRVSEVIRQLKDTSKRLHGSDERIPLISDRDIRVWLVPYLVQDSELAHLTADGKPPVGYFNHSKGNQGLQQMKQAVQLSVWVYLIDCWPTDISEENQSLQSTAPSTPEANLTPGNQPSPN
ncbi:MAG: hypothetical protein JNJ46_01830 [Myxococcales bacterium]|nr:hypothetical protein [Myxococcales bacterium]